MQLNEKAVRDLFHPDACFSFIVPKYQREYVWKKEQWEELLQDLTNEVDIRGKFLGAYFCLNKEDDNFKASKFELIDGQQRFFTLNILLLTIYRRLKLLDQQNNEEGIELNRELNADLSNIKGSLIFHDKKGKTVWSFTPSDQSRNKEDYGYLLARFIENKVESLRPKNFGNRRVSKAFEFFDRFLEGKDYDNVKALYKNLQSAHFVSIEVRSNADAFTLFETLNNRGTPLSVMDIVKNKLFSKLDDPKDKQKYIQQ